MHARGNRHRGSGTVMLVEDEPGVRALAREMLERLGYTVLEAASPAVALTISRSYQGPIDLLLADVVMPGMSGPTLARQLLGERPTLRVLYISGYMDKASVEASTLSPGAPFLQKPFDLQGLARKVREVLDEDPA